MANNEIGEQARFDAVKILGLQYARQWREAERFEQRRERIAQGWMTPKQFNEYLTARARAMRRMDVHEMAAARAGCTPRKDWIEAAA